LQIEPVGWLIDERWALPAIAIMSVWKGMGFYALILLAAMQDVPPVLYEAARVDGASSWRSFFAITLPGIAPAIQFVTVISVINSFQVFDQVYVLSNGFGGPGTSTYVYNILIYQNAFRQFQIGYASAMAWVLFAILFGLTYLQMRIARRTAAAGEGL
jgi:multiple sugar transport system permease protein